MTAAQPAPVRERPILFSAPMIRAILEGRKTQTRRVVKPQPTGRVATLKAGDGTTFLHDWNGESGKPLHCPYGASGDRLWVRENFALEVQVDGDQPLPRNDDRPVHRDSIGWTQAHYQATDPKPELECGHRSHEGDPCPSPWRPSIHMPRWASRIDLEVTEVRVQRLQGISEGDAMAEGAAADDISKVGLPAYSARQNFARLWDSINAERGFCWAANPWVWAITFKRVRP